MKIKNDKLKEVNGGTFKTESVVYSHDTSMTDNYYYLSEYRYVTKDSSPSKLQIVSGDHISEDLAPKAFSGKQLKIVGTSTDSVSTDIKDLQELGAQRFIK